MTESRSSFRLKVLAFVVVLMFAALTTRLYFLQVLAADKYRVEASENSVRFVKVPAPRGRILDRNGEPIVDRDSQIQVTIERQKIGDQKPRVLANLSALLGIPEPALERRMDDPKYYSFAPVPVAFHVREEIVAAIREHAGDFPGVDYRQVPARRYPQGDLAAHLLGSIGPITEEQQADPEFADYDPDDFVGQGGLERVYEHDLAGEDGLTKLQVDATGRVKRVLGSAESTPGNDIVLALDAKTQDSVEQKLAQGIERARGGGFPATSGATVVLEPKTGGIVAMASWPTFDPKMFADGLSKVEQKRLQLNRKNPPNTPILLNRATTGEYAPGSTLKPFIGLVALKERLVSMNTHFACTAEYQVSKGTRPFRNWSSYDQGSMTIASALPPSCDTVFYRIANEYFWPKFYKEGFFQDNLIHGPELLQKGLRQFGFGEYTGVDLPTGAAGLIPDQEWKYTTWQDEVSHRPGNFCAYNICPGDLIQMAIGQKDVKVTPLQLAQAYGVIATDGLLCEPHLGLEIRTPEGKLVRKIEPECKELEGYSDQHFRYIRGGLAGVVQGNGTAAGVFSGFDFGRVQLWGKTGSAEVANQRETNSWFAAITKGRDRKGETREYVTVVMIERGGHGSETAAPIARQIIESIYGLGESKFRFGEAAD